MDEKLFDLLDRVGTVELLGADQPGGDKAENMAVLEIGRICVELSREGLTKAGMDMHNIASNAESEEIRDRLIMLMSVLLHISIVAEQKSIEVAVKQRKPIPSGKIQNLVAMMMSENTTAIETFATMAFGIGYELGRSYEK